MCFFVWGGGGRCIYVYMYIHMYICMCMRVCVYIICIYVCTFCMYGCIGIHNTCVDKIHSYARSGRPSLSAEGWPTAAV